MCYLNVVFKFNDYSILVSSVSCMKKLTGLLIGNSRYMTFEIFGFIEYY